SSSRNPSLDRTSRTSHRKSQSSAVRLPRPPPSPPPADFRGSGNRGASPQNRRKPPRLRPHALIISNSYISPDLERPMHVYGRVKFKLPEGIRLEAKARINPVKGVGGTMAVVFGLTLLACGWFITRTLGPYIAAKVAEYKQRTASELAEIKSRTSAELADL